MQGRGFSAFFKPWPHIQAHTSSRLQMCRRIFCSPCSSKDLFTESYRETQRMSWELAQRLWGAPGTWRGPHCKWQNKSTSTEGRSEPGNGFQPRDTPHPEKPQPRDPEIRTLHASSTRSLALALVTVPQHGLNCSLSEKHFAAGDAKCMDRSPPSPAWKVFAFRKDVGSGCLGIRPPPWQICLT